MYEPTIVHFAVVARDKAEALRRAPFGFFVGAMLAGAYIGIAMILALSSAAGLPAGVRPLVLGAVFGVGLILTVFAGAELFTGYVMYAGLGLARRTVGWGQVAWMMSVVWLGNLAGALILSGLFIACGGGAVLTDGGTYLNSYATHKVDADALALLARAILCNWLVCLAIWTATRVTGDAAKCIVLAWILFAFVTPGLEHSVANMTALSLGLLDPQPAIALGGVIRNLALVTIGNIIGGGVFVAGGYIAAATTDNGDEARHDTGKLPGGLRTPAATPAE